MCAAITVFFPPTAPIAASTPGAGSSAASPASGATNWASAWKPRPAALRGPANRQPEHIGVIRRQPRMWMTPLEEVIHNRQTNLRWDAVYFYGHAARVLIRSLFDHLKLGEIALTGFLSSFLR